MLQLTFQQNIEHTQLRQNKCENVGVHTTTHGFTMFKFRGPKVFNNIKDFDFYTDSKSVQSFRKKYKSYLIEIYE